MTDLENFYSISCPHCLGIVLVQKNELNCKIFRHAVYKNNMEPINPHASKEECEKLLEDDKILGCGKPFRIILSNQSNENNISVEICDYI